jgi:hypothetical protein
VSGPRVSARAQRTVVLGAATIAAAVVFVFGVLPIAERWRAREAAIGGRAQQIAFLRGLVDHEAELREAVSRYEAAPPGAQRMLTERTPELAAATLQSLLRELAGQSRLTVSSLNVTGQPMADDGAGPLSPAPISAIGDIHGIAEMLFLLQHGPQLLEVAELTVRPNPALRGELLQMTVRLRAAYLGAEP